MLIHNSPSTATSDLPGGLGIVCSKFGFTMSSVRCAAAPLVAKIETVTQKFSQNWTNDHGRLFLPD
jgi:hypothetical protein